MKPLKGKVFRIITIFIVLSLCLVGCGNSKGKEDLASVKEKVELNAGAVMKNQNGEYKLFNYENGEFSSVDVDGIVLAYDKQSSNYVCLQNQVPYVVTKNEKYQLPHSDYSSLKLSVNGKYVSYFIDDKGLKLKVVNTESNKIIDLNSNVTISGSFYDWYDEDTIMYYGISNDGVNGIFAYNFNDNTEELKYKIKEGFLAYFECYDKNIVFLKSNFQGEKEFMTISKDATDAEILTNEIDEISDVIVNDNKYYFMGKQKDNSKSLYMLKDKKIKRMVYDFPSNLKVNKGLVLDSERNVLFIGSNGSNASEEQLYKCSEDGTIISLFENSTDFMFIVFSK